MIIKDKLDGENNLVEVYEVMWNLIINVEGD